jgi:hypothetical protein
MPERIDENSIISCELFYWLIACMIKEYKILIT